MGREIKIKSYAWVLWVEVVIEKRYRGWMDAAKIDIEERI